MLEVVGFLGLIVSATGVVTDNVELLLCGVLVVIVSGVIFINKNKRV